MCVCPEKALLSADIRQQKVFSPCTAASSFHRPKSYSVSLRRCADSFTTRSSSSSFLILHVCWHASLLTLHLIMRRDCEMGNCRGRETGIRESSRRFAEAANDAISEIEKLFLTLSSPPHPPLCPGEGESGKRSLISSVLLSNRTL